MLTEVAFLTCKGREFQMAAPEYMNDLRNSSQLGFAVYSWLQLVDLVSRHDMSANGIRTRANKKVRCNGSGKCIDNS